MTGETRRLIFNADDFGASHGVNRGIIEAHTAGVVTSTSMMVTGSAVAEAVALSRDHPELAIGLHWDVWGEDERDFDMHNLPAVRREFDAQLARFQDLTGRNPTHVDSHKHAHRQAMELFCELVAPLGVPLRDDGQVRYVSGFYAQWEWKVTDLAHVSVQSLLDILRSDVHQGWTEIGCHPGYPSDDYDSVYLHERAHETATLIDPRIRAEIVSRGIELASYADVDIA